MLLSGLSKGFTPEFLNAVRNGDIKGCSMLDKFGAVLDVGTSLVPLATAQVYRTPTTLTTLEMLSDDNINDTAAGAGALTVRVYGITTGWLEDFEDVTLTGTTPVTLTKQWYRVYRMQILTSGSYATQATPSHNSTITLRVPGPGLTWATISLEDSFGFGQSLIGCNTIPADKIGYLVYKNVSVESGKNVSLFRFVREGCNVVAAPFKPMRLQHLSRGLAGGHSEFSLGSWRGPWVGPCDYGYLVKAAAGTTASVGIDYSMLLIDK